MLDCVCKCGKIGIIKTDKWYCKSCMVWTTEADILENNFRFRKRLEYERMLEKLFYHPQFNYYGSKLLD